MYWLGRKKILYVTKGHCCIINDYNEEGIFLITCGQHTNDKIYWFNGKRWEYYCDGPQRSIMYPCIGQCDGVLYQRSSGQINVQK